MPMRVVTNNAIVLVDFAITEVERTPALIEASRRHAQPVVITTAAMTADTVPSAFGIGDGGALRSPLAIALIGGMLAATFLGLVFVPAAFAILDDLGRILGSKLRASCDRKAEWRRTAMRRSDHVIVSGAFIVAAPT